MYSATVWLWLYRTGGYLERLPSYSPQPVKVSPLLRPHQAGPQLAQQSFINQIPINFFIAAFRFQKNNWLTSFQRAAIYSVTRQKTRCDQCPWLHHLCSRHWRMWLACQLRGAAAAAGWKWSRGGMDWGARGGPTGNMDTGHIGHNKPDNSLFRSS